MAAKAWIVVVVADLEDYLVAAQVSALRTAALGGSQADPFTNVMHDIASRIRLKIESCARNVLSATEYSIPPELKWAACYLILEAMQGRLPGLRLTEEQKSQIERANKDLDAIAACDLAVTEPLDPESSEAQMGGAIEVVSSTSREATRAKMNGL